MFGQGDYDWICPEIDEVVVDFKNGITGFTYPCARVSEAKYAEGTECSTVKPDHFFVRAKIVSSNFDPDLYRENQ